MRGESKDQGKQSHFQNSNVNVNASVRLIVSVKASVNKAIWFCDQENDLFTNKFINLNVYLIC